MTFMLPMFPLGTVLMPYEVLPLRVFEPRYLEMLQHCLLSDSKRFGVVLIERGREVGGGDVRCAVGTTARVMEAAELPSGMWGVRAFGATRLSVQEWLPDDPYPIALINEWPDPSATDQPNAAEVAKVVARLRQILARCAEATIPAAPATTEFADVADVAQWQACSRAPLSTYDRYRLLAAPDARTRLTMLAVMLEEADTLVAHRLNG